MFPGVVMPFIAADEDGRDTLVCKSSNRASSNRVNELLHYSYRKIQQDETAYQNLLYHIYMKLSMIWATDRPSSGASYKYGIINFDTLLHLVGFFCMNCTMMHGSMNIKNYYIVVISVSYGTFQPKTMDHSCVILIIPSADL
jgi:hypothetical protein